MDGGDRVVGGEPPNAYTWIINTFPQRIKGYKSKLVLSFISTGIIDKSS